jgi:hypothetical protein
VRQQLFTMFQSNKTLLLKHENNLTEWPAKKGEVRALAGWPLLACAVPRAAPVRGAASAGVAAGCPGGG